MIHTECKNCELSKGDCGNHFKMDGKTNYEIASLSACDRYGNCMFFKSKAKPKGERAERALAIIDRLRTDKHINNKEQGILRRAILLPERPQDKWGKWVISEIQCPICLEYFQTDCYSTEELKKCPCCDAELVGGES